MAAHVGGSSLGELGQPCDRLADPFDRLTVVQIEYRSMPRTYHASLFDLAATQWYSEMWAQVIDRDIPIIHVHDHDAPPPDLKRLRGIRRDITNRRQLKSCH